jgi:hypothetical protein
MNLLEAAPLSTLPFIQSLVSVRECDDSIFVSLPMSYAEGTSVTVQISSLPDKRFRVSDAGFAYRQLEQLGTERSFSRMAAPLVELYCLHKGTESIFVDVTIDQLQTAIEEVASVSWRIVERAYTRISEEDQLDFSQEIALRLQEIFGADKVVPSTTLIGASTSEWEISATVRTKNKIVVFQAVGSHSNSVYRANAAFDDLAALDRPPGLVAVVKSKQLLGPKLVLLARQANIIEEAQANSAYQAAAA